MANVPGVVTDPSRIKGGVISLSSGGSQIAAYVAQPKVEKLRENFADRLRKL